MKNIVEVLQEEGFELTPIGELYRTHCPFHTDIGTPNFTVYPKTNSYYCYACNSGGSVLTFYVQYLGITYDEAKKKAGVLNGDADLLQKIIHATTKKFELDTHAINFFIGQKIRELFYQYPEKQQDIFQWMQTYDKNPARTIDDVEKRLEELNTLTFLQK